MKATGVVRRIDDLGRIVIPKEIRKNLRIREGENLEIYIENEERIVLQKYSLLNKIDDLAQSFTDAINMFTNHNILITDTDNIIAFSGPLKKKYLNQPISEKLLSSINRRENLFEKHKKDISLIDNDMIEATYVISTIVASGDAVGLVILFSTDDAITTTDEKITQISAKFLAKHLEE